MLFVIVDDFSRSTWTPLLESKNDTFSTLKNISKRLKNKNYSNICVIRSDHGENFK